MRIERMGRASRVAWLVAVSFLGAMAACAAGLEVRDGAGLFSADAVSQANEAVRNVRREFHKDLLVETFAGVPENRSADYNRDRDGFFADLVQERAQAARLDGIYVLVMKEPPPRRMHIQVGVGQATRSRAFLTTDRDQLVKLFQSSFRDGKYDEGLMAGIGFVERTLRANLGSRGTFGSTARPNGVTTAGREASPGKPISPMGSARSLIVLAALIFGGILLIRLIMRMLRGGFGGRGVPSQGGMMGTGGGGGGFFSSLLGGIGGAMAGSWLYDRFFGNHASSGDSWASSAADTTPSDVGGDFASSGGDVDSGSDLGSTDSGGGGDFGGGDFDGGGGGDV